MCTELYVQRMTTGILRGSIYQSQVIERSCLTNVIFMRMYILQDKKFSKFSVVGCSDVGGCIHYICPVLGSKRYLSDTKPICHGTKHLTD